MVTNGPKWSQMVLNGPKWSQFVRIGPKLSQLVSNCPKYSKMVQIGPKWSQMIQNEHRGTFCVLFIEKKHVNPLWLLILEKFQNYLFTTIASEINIKKCSRLYHPSLRSTIIAWLLKIFLIFILPINQVEIYQFGTNCTWPETQQW